MKVVVVARSPEKGLGCPNFSSLGLEVGGGVVEGLELGMLTGAGGARVWTGDGVNVGDGAP